MESDMREAFCRCGAANRFQISRRKGLAALLGAGLAGAFASIPENASAGAALTPPQPEDERFMRLAIAEAAKADFPFGAVVVRAGDVIAAGRNIGKTNDDPTAHAEMNAMRQLIAAGATATLKGATLYASGEPCPMCMGAILWCGVGRVVFAASIAELSTKIGQIMVTSQQLAEAAPFANIVITGGVLAAESLALFKG
jgi:tRNA(adenine34) deaminase